MKIHCITFYDQLGQLLKTDIFVELFNSFDCAECYKKWEKSSKIFAGFY